MLRLFEITVLWFGITAVASAANRTWIGGDADWTSSNANWTGNPQDEPDFDDVAIFNQPNSVDLAIASQTILGLTMSNEIDLSTNGNDLTVNGSVVLSDANTDLTVGGAGSLLSADSITINSGAEITLTGGQITVNEETGSGVLDVNDGGELSGNGTILFSDVVSAGTQLFNLDGTLTAHSTAAGDFLSLAAATLRIEITDRFDGLIDLDGNDGVSTINVLRNDTLSFDGGVLDSAYSGTINLSAGATFFISNWSLNGTVNANTGGSTAATLSSSQLTQTGGSINVDAGESLRFVNRFNGLDGVIANNGLIIFNGETMIDHASQFQTGPQGSLEVNGTVIVFDEGWDWDGDGGLDNVVTINDPPGFGTGTLAAINNADDMWDGLMHINGGVLTVEQPDDEWSQTGGLINIGGTTTSQIGGDVFNKTGGAFNIEPAADLFINNNGLQWSGGALNVDGLLRFAAPVTWSGGIAVSGNGLISTLNSSVVAASTTINVHTFDWDYYQSNQVEHVHSINSGATFTLNIVDFDGDDDDMDEPINLGGNGAQLIINGPAQWIMNDTFTANTTGAGTATIGGTSRMVLVGTLDVNGNTTVDAPITFDNGSTTNIDNFASLRLSGGNLTNDPNRLQGGTISGGGFSFLRADSGSALHGFGTINTLIDFDDSADLKADNGILTLNGSITDVNVLGTADADGTLNIPAAWNTGTGIAAVEMQGGEIRGGTITNDGVNGINGFGLISSRVVNNTRVDAEGGTLVVETANNDNDWDGAPGAGSLNAVSGDLEIRDDATFLFIGTVSAAAGREIFANNFELEFEPGSTLSLADGARYRSTNGTDIGGAVTVTGGTASLEIDGTTVFENGSATMLTGDLRMENPVTVVQAGAMFAGGGTLINAPDRTLRLLDGANVGVLIENQGTLELGASPGQVQGIDFQQDSSGVLEIELAGIGLNDFDRLALTGQAQLAGALNLSLLDGFTPALGNVFGFLSAVGGVAGTFETTSLPDLAAGLSWSISYNSTNVQLSVVQVLPGDYNRDGSVDAADYTVWRDTLGSITDLAADGDASGTIDDTDYVVWKEHFGATAAVGAASRGPTSAVPEPASLLPLMIGATMLALLVLRIDRSHVARTRLTN